MGMGRQVGIMGIYFAIPFSSLFVSNLSLSSVLKDDFSVRIFITLLSVDTFKSHSTY